MNNIEESKTLMDLKDSLKDQDFFSKISLFISGTFLSALSFTMFFSPQNIVTGGTSGLALVINSQIPIRTSIFVFLSSFILLLISLITLGPKPTIKTLAGVILYPVFLEFTEVYNNYIDLSGISLFLTMITGGIISGFGNGIILKSGYSLGGFQTLYQIIYKYFKVSIGTSSMIINGIVVFLGGFTFGFDKVLYALIALYISSIITDKVIIGISENKTFNIVTTKEKDVNEFIVNTLGHDATIINAKGGYFDESKKMVMCTVPTREYFLMREIIKKIDKKAFFLVTDTYEIKGGK